MSSLVLIHAFPLDSTMYDAIDVEIAETGWDVFTPDLRGFGGASDFADEPDLTDCAKDVIAMLDRFGVEKAVIGGTSLGGYVTLNLLTNYPERVAGVILIDTKATSDTDDARANRLKVASQVEQAASAEAFCRAMLTNLLSASTQANKPEVVRKVKAIMQHATPQAVANMQRAMANRPDSLAAITAFRGPLLSIRGAEDIISTEADHQAMIAAAQDATHVEVPNSGHLPPLEAPAETLIAIKSFLSKLTKGSC